MSRFLGIVEIVMRDRRAGTIQQKSYAAIFPLVQRSLNSLTAEPALTQSANASRVATREVKALLLLNHVAAIQVECRERAAGSGGGERVEVRVRPVVKCKTNFPPQSRWGINE